MTRRERIAMRAANRAVRENPPVECPILRFERLRRMADGRFVSKRRTLKAAA